MAAQGAGTTRRVSGRFDKESKDRAIQGLDVLRSHIALLTRTRTPGRSRQRHKFGISASRTLIGGVQVNICDG